MTKSTDTSQKVMDRILTENRWSLPVHKQEKKRKSLRSFGLLLSILILMSISVSFIYINPVTSQQKTSLTTNHSKVNNIDFAKKYYHLEFDVIQGGTIASIGEPGIYQPSDGNNNNYQEVIIFSILGLSLITLVFSWISTEKK